jgi:hypothetical protein
MDGPFIIIFIKSEGPFFFLPTNSLSRASISFTSFYNQKINPKFGPIPVQLNPFSSFHNAKCHFVMPFPDCPASVGANVRCCAAFP